MVAGAAALIASMPGAPKGAALKQLILKHVDVLPFLKGKVCCPFSIDNMDQTR